MSKSIFIHIPKNGGLTIRWNPDIKQKIIIAGKETHKSPQYTRRLFETMQANGDHHGFEHSRWRDVNPALTSKHKSVAIIRNPWDRVVSRYFFARKVIYVEENSDHYGNTDYCDCSSFEAFLEERHKWGDKEFMWHRAVRGWYPAADHVTDEMGNVRCDLLSFEHYNEDIQNYFGLLSAPRARNVTNLNKGSYMDLYTPETIQIVADWYKKDIELFGYDFDTGPKKNTYYKHS